MTTQHTPGPWGVTSSSNPKNGSSWRDIVSYGTEFKPSYVGEALEQDANLIAAAPELLEALEKVVAILTQPVQRPPLPNEAFSGKIRIIQGDCACAVNAARYAIAKAKGE